MAVATYCSSKIGVESRFGSNPKTDLNLNWLYTTLKMLIFDLFSCFNCTFRWQSGVSCPNKRQSDKYRCHQSIRRLEASQEDRRMRNLLLIIGIVTIKQLSSARANPQKSNAIVQHVKFEALHLWIQFFFNHFVSTTHVIGTKLLSLKKFCKSK